MSVALINLKTARGWIEDGRPMAVATLVETEGSSPLDVGAMMLVDAEDNIEGSVTGGCVEGALVEEAHEVLAGGAPRVRTYGISDEQAAGVGLMCGGTVHVFIEVLGEEPREVLGAALAAATEERPVAVATLIDGEGAGSRLAVIEGEVSGGLGIAFLDKTVTRETRGMLEQGVTALRRYGADGAAMGSDLRVSVRSFAEPPRMVIFGAIDFSVATAALARQLGYRVTIVDPREPFIRSQRFSSVAEVVVDWPDRYLEGQELTGRDVVLVFSHDAKLDEPALISGLGSGAGYVGALGSRRTQAQRAERLLEAGVAQAEIDRIAAPCGLDIGARTPPETAVSILGEVIAAQNARSAESLSGSEGPIHSKREVAPS
ncbi:MAG: XdhC/CoxI family protein [Solirubrobacterales bacterium]|nr:XdhC/CoxI family protein [Solirubrobacterales bacterium]